MEIVLLSCHPELSTECANLLNKQWKRSISARVQSLEKSLTQLPDSLLLTEETENGTQIIGHSRLTRVLEDPHGCWIGSVVIREDKRKKGYGKFIMQKTQEYAKSLQFSTAYLNTHDQQGFYEHLGYSYCDPVSSISFSWNGCLPKSTVHSNNNNYGSSNVLEQSQDSKNINTNTTKRDSNSSTETTSIPPPPPPPPQQVGENRNKRNGYCNQSLLYKC